MLYREPLGLIFLVVASLASSFLINPMCLLFNQPLSAVIPPWILALGIIGAILCVIERQPQVEDDPNVLQKWKK
jgi:hypothetical protein